MRLLERLIKFMTPARYKVFEWNFDSDCIKVWRINSAQFKLILIKMAQFYQFESEVILISCQNANVVFNELLKPKTRFAQLSSARTWKRKPCFWQLWECESLARSRYWTCKLTSFQLFFLTFLIWIALHYKQ